MKARLIWGLRPWKRHGLILTVAGIVYILVGFAYVTATPNSNRSTALQILLRVAPIEIWGGVFILAGVLAIISSRWPPFVETWGYVALTGLSVGWSAAYLTGMLFGDSPWSNASGCLVWGLMGFLWWAISGLSNPDKAAMASGNRPN